MDIQGHYPPYLVAKCRLLYNFSCEFSFLPSLEFQMIIVFSVLLQGCVPLWTDSQSFPSKHKISYIYLKIVYATTVQISGREADSTRDH